MELGRFKSVLNSSSIYSADRNLDSACLGQQIAEQVEKILKTRCRDQRVKWSGSISSWLPNVPIHHDHLLTLILNLASNALERDGEGGNSDPRRRTTDAGKMIELRITDTGAGIGPGDLKEMDVPSLPPGREKWG